MRSLFRKVFGIYPGEGKNTLRFARLALFWAFASTCLDTLSDGLFLEHVGAASLPSVYLSIALGMIAVSSLVLYSLKVTSPYRILTSAMGVGILICGLAALFVAGSPPDWFWYALKISSRMFFSVLIAASWTFIDQYHDLQDAKRVYSLYSAAYFLGSIASGTFINLMLDWLGFSGLFLLSALSIALAFTEARGIAYRTAAVHDDTVEGVFSGSRDSFSSLVSLIARSRFAILLLGLSLVTQLLITVTEFNYLDAFDRSFNAFEGHITEFLGKCRAWISACNILISVFFYSRFVRRLGLNNAILITPLFFLLVYIGWVVRDSVLLAILGLIAVDGILFTIEDNCFNLLSNAVPSKLKSKVRIVNDSFFEPIGMLISSLLLFCAQGNSRWIGLSLSVLVLGLTLGIRAIYSKAIFVNLKDNALHFERNMKNWIASLTRREQKEAKKDIVEALRSNSEETQLLAIESLLQLGENGVLPQILEVGRRLGTLSKIQLLKLFEGSSFANDSRVIEAIDAWIYESGSSELAKWGNFYLAKRGLQHPDKVEGDLDHPDLFLRGAAILTLKKSLANHSLDYAALNRTIASKNSI